MIWSGKDKSRIPFKGLSEVQSFGFDKCDNATEGWISQNIIDANEAKSLLIKVANWVDSVDNS